MSVKEFLQKLFHCEDVTSTQGEDRKSEHQEVAAEKQRATEAIREADQAQVESAKLRKEGQQVFSQLRRERETNHFAYIIRKTMGEQR